MIAMLYQKRQLECFDKIFRLSLYLQLFHVKHFEFWIGHVVWQKVAIDVVTKL